MELKEEQILVVRIVEKASSIYRNLYLSEKIFTDQFYDNYLALKLFLRNYAHERQRVPPDYKRIAIDSIENRFKSGKVWNICKDDPDTIWKLYKKKAQSKKYSSISFDSAGQPNLNIKNNPMNSVSGIINQLLIIPNLDNNIAKHITKLLEENQIIEANLFIRAINGIGPKISALYLRDIAFLSEINEEELNNNYLLQPIDLWVERVGEILFEDAWKPISQSKKIIEEKQKKMVELCHQTNVSAISFNQGVWVIGSYIAESKENLKEYLKNPIIFIKNLEKETNSLIKYISTIKKLIQ